MKNATQSKITLKVSRLLAILVIAILGLMLAACQNNNSKADSKSSALLIGADDSPLLSQIYAVFQKPSIDKTKLELKHFKTSGDIGYALIAGKLDAGFVETSKALQLLKSPGGEKLKIAGAIQFPYGATLVLHKDLNIRLNELPGKTIAASEPDCKLLHQFLKDVTRQGIDKKLIKIKYMSFDEMIPALEAKAVDGVLLKGSYAILAEQIGHKILYQNWDIVPGDDCCPASLAKTDYFLVVNDQKKTAIESLLKDLTASNKLSPAELRQAIHKQIGYPLQALEQFPLSSFEIISGDLIKEIGEQRCLLLR